MILIRYLELAPKKWADLQEAEVLTHESALLLRFQAFTSPLTSFKCAAAWNTHLLKLKVVQLRAIPLHCDNCHCLLLWWEQQLPPDLIGTLARRKCKTCIFFLSPWQSWQSAMKVDVDLQDLKGKQQTGRRVSLIWCQLCAFVYRTCWLDCVSVYSICIWVCAGESAHIRYLSCYSALRSEI